MHKEVKSDGFFCMQRTNFKVFIFQETEHASDAMNDRKWVIKADQWCVVMEKKHEKITKTENFFSKMV